MISPEKQKQIRKLGQRVPVLSDRAIARIANVSRDAVAKYRGAVPSEALQAESEELLSPEMHLKDSRALERMRIDNTRLRAANRILTRSGVMGVESIVNQFSEELRTEEYQRFEFAPKVYPKGKVVNSVFDKDHDEIATLVISDWHIGETIRPEESNGVNKFNSIIAANRIYAIVDKFKRIFRGHEQMYKLGKIWLPVLGDLINGSIHPDFILTNDLLDIPSAILAARLLIMVVLELKTLGVPIEIDTVVGNHPRLVPQMPAKRQAELSLDWLIYKYVEEKFIDDPQVTVRVHDGQFGIIKQYGHRFVIEHGYGAKSGEALPDRLRKMFDSPLYREATGMEGSSVDCVIIGDKHRSESGQGYFVNGGLPGQGEYGVMLRLDPITACQWMFGISKSHVRTFFYELDVTGNTNEGASNPMSAYATEYMSQHGR